MEHSVDTTTIFFWGGPADGGWKKFPVGPDGLPMPGALYRNKRGDKLHYHYERISKVVRRDGRVYWLYTYKGECDGHVLPG